MLELVQSDAGVPLPQLYETLKAALGSAGLRTSLAPPTEMQAGAEPGAPLLQGPRGPASTGNGAGTDGMQSVRGHLDWEAGGGSVCRSRAAGHVKVLGSGRHSEC